VRKRSQVAALVAHHWLSHCVVVVKLAFLLGLLHGVLKRASKVENQFCALIAAFKLCYFSSLRIFKGLKENFVSHTTINIACAHEIKLKDKMNHWHLTTIRKWTASQHAI
jgi:hypothetical protein